MSASHVYSIRGPRLIYMLTGGCLAAIVVAVAATAPDNAHRAGGAAIAAAFVLAAYLGWRCSRIVTSESGVAITPNVSTRHFSWSEVESFEYRVGPVGLVGVHRLYLVVRLRSGQLCLVPQFNSAPRRKDSSYVAKTVAALNEELTRHSGNPSSRAPAS